MLASALALPVVGCRGDAAAPSEPPKSDVPKRDAPRSEVAVTNASAANAREPAADPGASEEAAVTTTRPPTPAPEGPPLAADAVVPHFQRWWKVWSSEHLATHPLVATLDERVAAGGHAKQEACDVLAEHIAERAPAGSPARLFGDPAALRGRSSRCWWLHHDGMMGPGLGAALASDGTVLVVWIVSEG